MKYLGYILAVASCSISLVILPGINIKYIINNSPNKVNIGGMSIDAYSKSDLTDPKKMILIPAPAGDQKSILKLTLKDAKEKVLNEYDLVDHDMTILNVLKRIKPNTPNDALALIVTPSSFNPNPFYWIQLPQ